MLAKLQSAIQNFDKAEHFILGALVALCPIYPLIAVIIVAVGKEIYDHFHPDVHTCDAMDAIATIVGGLTMLQLLG